jgi:hypothetical protein
LVKGGRARWKIENEAFNTLKNQGYHLEHKLLTFHQPHLIGTGINPCKSFNSEINEDQISDLESWPSLAIVLNFYL